MAVEDGDTITVLPAGSRHTVRLAGIDAPELGQSFGEEARRALARFVLDREVRLQPRGKDQYGRALARVVVNGDDVATELVKAGMAWVDVAQPADADLAVVEARARAGSVGLWSTPGPVPPWEFRAGRRSLSDIAHGVTLRAKTISRLPSVPRPTAEAGGAPTATPSTSPPPAPDDRNADRRPAGACAPAATVGEIWRVYNLEWAIELTVDSLGCCPAGTVEVVVSFDGASGPYEVRRRESWRVSSPAGALHFTTSLNATSVQSAPTRIGVSSVACD